MGIYSNAEDDSASFLYEALLVQNVLKSLVYEFTISTFIRNIF
jgi:hypothetical protein